MVYRKEQVYVGAILRIEVDHVFDGYAQILEPQGKELTEMLGDNSPVISARRWLVAFSPLDQCPELSAGETFTQKAQKGRRTHRIIRYIVGNFSRNYRRFSKEPPPKEPELDKELMDDLNLIF